MTLATVPRYDRDQVSTVGDHAVVVGASVAGLCAARVLADAFERVTVVEKDDVPEEPMPRSGVPQDTQVHALQTAGRETLADLCPGYGEDLVSAGAMLIDGASDIAFYAEGDFLADGPRRVPTYCASRPLFEHVVRRHVTDREDVRLRSRCRVIDYLLDDSATTVEGVSVRDRRSGQERLRSDLVVDATGRTSHTPTWLDDHGFTAPTVEEVDVDIGYSTTTVERPPDDRRMVLVPASAPHLRGGAAVPVEDGRWQVNLHGMHGDHPPTDRDAFETFAASLRDPTLKNLLDSHAWTDDAIDYYPFPSNRRHHYEDLSRFPERLVVVGDAVASFNPIYGQGMSVAALESVALHHALAADGTEALAERFFERAASVVDTAWLLAVGGDCQFAQTADADPFGVGRFTRYLSRLQRRAHTDGELSDAFLRVVAMERPPSSLLRPNVARRVLRPDWADLRGLLAWAARLPGAQTT